VHTEYRRGAKLVHHALDLGGQKFVRLYPCNLDAGGAWGMVKPDGPACPDCKGLETMAADCAVVPTRKASARAAPGARPYAMAASGLLMVGLLALAGQGLGLTPTAAVATPSVTLGGGVVLVPSAAPPSAAPVPAPTSTPEPSPTPEPERLVIRTVERVIERTLVIERQAAPAPASAPPCRPGLAVGLHGSCKWGHR
jgi:hypothetical protein